jgi:dTMP kinase
MGVFITFEGPEGSGKTTQIGLLCDYLKSCGCNVLHTREPGGTPIGDQIRTVLHDVYNEEMAHQTEFLLYSASRAQLVREVMNPHLEKGGVVVSDRFADSSMAYQGYGRQLNLDSIRAITQFATGGLTPDLTIYLDLPVEIGLGRKLAAHHDESGEWNRLDREQIDFHERVRTGYLEMAKDQPDRWLVIDATRGIEATQQLIRQRLAALLPQLREAVKK